MLISHNRAKCIGCRGCVSACPTWWLMDKDGKAILMDSTETKGLYSGSVDDDFRSAMIDAVKRCPVNIIRIEH